VGASVGSGPFAGTNIALSALSQLGSIVNHKSIPLLSQNRRPAKYDTRNTFQYIKDLQQTQSTSDSSAPTVTVTQDEKTVGTFLTVVPDAQDDGQVLLTIAYDDTRLIEMKKQPLGSRDDQSFVQQGAYTGCRCCVPAPEAVEQNFPVDAALVQAIALDGDLFKDEAHPTRHLAILSVQKFTDSILRILCIGDHDGVGRTVRRLDYACATKELAELGDDSGQFAGFFLRTVGRLVRER